MMTGVPGGRDTALALTSIPDSLYIKDVQVLASKCLGLGAIKIITI